MLRPKDVRPTIIVSVRNDDGAVADLDERRVLRADNGPTWEEAPIVPRSGGNERQEYRFQYLCLALQTLARGALRVVRRGAAPSFSWFATGQD
jgi:hypothetical protein